MKRVEIEKKIDRLEFQLQVVMNGREGSLDALIEHAAGEGLGYRAYALAKENIEAKIAEARKELEALPKMSSLEYAEYEYKKTGIANAPTKAYIAALEKCRPWVIRSKSTGALMRRVLSGDIFMYSTKEMADMDRVELDRPSEWEVDQWEGEQ